MSNCGTQGKKGKQSTPAATNAIPKLVQVSCMLKWWNGEGEDWKCVLLCVLDYAVMHARDVLGLAHILHMHV